MFVLFVSFKFISHFVFFSLLTFIPIFIFIMLHFFPSRRHPKLYQLWDLTKPESTSIFLLFNLPRPVQNFCDVLLYFPLLNAWPEKRELGPLSIFFFPAVAQGKTGRQAFFGCGLWSSEQQWAVLGRKAMLLRKKAVPGSTFRWEKGTVRRCRDNKQGDEGSEFSDLTEACWDNSYRGCWMKGGNPAFLSFNHLRLHDKGIWTMGSLGVIVTFPSLWSLVWWNSGRNWRSDCGKAREDPESSQEGAGFPSLQPGWGRCMRLAGSKGPRGSVLKSYVQITEVSRDCNRSSKPHNV